MTGGRHAGAEISTDRTGRHHCNAHKKSVRFSGGRIIQSTEREVQYQIRNASMGCGVFMAGLATELGCVTAADVDGVTEGAVCVAAGAVCARCADDTSITAF
jgi:hypothetical protein